tara:strand:- start:3223 stop:3639 length:417 start_codon:yes stop_codon:yes gene_type:complete
MIEKSNLPVNDWRIYQPYGLSNKHKTLVVPVIKKIRVYSERAATKLHTRVLKAADFTLQVKQQVDDKLWLTECYWWMNTSKFYKSGNTVSVFGHQAHNVGASIGNFLVYKYENSYHPVFFRAWNGSKCIYATCYINFN